MEEFVLDLLAFVHWKAGEVGDKFINVESVDGMTEDERQEFEMAGGMGVAYAVVSEFILRRYQLFCEKKGDAVAAIPKDG